MTALVAQALGRKEPDEANRAATSGLTVAVAVGVAFGLVGLLTGRPLLHILGAENAAWQAAWDYFEVVAWIAPMFFVSGTLRSVLTGEIALRSRRYGLNDPARKHSTSGMRFDILEP